MGKSVKQATWTWGDEITSEVAADGVLRKVLSYNDQLMCVENTFAKDAIGALHSHPHTQITYVVSGEFEFTIGEETKVVKAGDSLLKEDGIVHGCRCLASGILLDIFNPKRDDFV